MKNSIVIALCLVFIAVCSSGPTGEEKVMDIKIDLQIPEEFDKKNGNTTYGNLTQVEYYSTTTQAARKCYIYTPPGYDPQKTYPVLYLLHGIGGTHSEWLGGAPNEILSNLIASGKAPPMIVVMPNVRAMQNDSVPSYVYGQANVAAFNNFINDLRDDLMPFIKENYPVSEKREERAIAGLSMGGMEALYIGVSMPETFGYIGAFSPAPGLPLTAEQMTLPGEYKNNTFILICCGNQDGLLSFASSYHANLENSQIKRLFYYTIDGGHDFGVWKHGLYNFAKNIFR